MLVGRVRSKRPYSWNGRGHDYALCVAGRRGALRTMPGRQSTERYVRWRRAWVIVVDSHGVVGRIVLVGALGLVALQRDLSCQPPALADNSY
jgi:hypothetical protein